MSAYCDAVGRLDPDAAGALFAADAAIRIAGFPEISGRDAIVEGMRTTFAACSFLFQQCDTGLIDIDGDKACSRLSVFEARRKPGADTIGLIFGFYEDDYIRLPQGWHFARRHYSLRLRASIAADRLQEIPGSTPARSFRPIPSDFD